MICAEESCCAEIQKNKAGRPKRYCDLHSSPRARKARSRQDVKRFPCGCKASGLRAQCPQHLEHAERISWASPDERSPDYEAPLRRPTHRPQPAPEVVEDLSLRLLLAYQPKGQWMTERPRVIGQWDLDVDWQPANMAWRDTVGFKAEPGSSFPGPLVRRGADWPWSVAA